MMRALIRLLVYYLVIGLILGIAVKCQAADTWVDVSTTSYHFSDRVFNRNNFGLGLERDWGDVFAAGGRYSNSLGQPSRYALVGWTPVHFHGLAIGAVAGALDGYPGMNGGHAFPAAAGLVRWSTDRWGAQLMLLPGISGSVTHDADGGTWTRRATPAAIGLQLRWRLK